MKNIIQSQSGFSLVELVSVIVLIAILAVFAAPKITGTAGMDEYVVRDQLISAFRFAQQHAMYDQATGHCYRVNVVAHGYSVQRSTDNGLNFTTMSDFDLDAADASVSTALGKVTLPAFTQYFDGLGNPVAGGTPPASCLGGSSGSWSFNIVGGSSIPVCIYATGYVRAGTCI